MTNTEELQKCISVSGISITFLAKQLGISREGFYNKLNGITEFKASEIAKIAQLLRLTDAERNFIFFAE